MDQRIEAIVKFTKEKLGLADYHLPRCRLERHVNVFNETNYTLVMEWFPKHVSTHEPDLNPEGTAVVEIDVHRKRLKSVIFVAGVSGATNFNLPNHDFETVNKWIEQETGLTYEDQFKCVQQTNGQFLYNACFNNVLISPPGFIELKLDDNSNIVFFAVHGHFPTAADVKEEAFKLSLADLESYVYAQLKIVEMPDLEQETTYSVYALEEINITNDQAKTWAVELEPDYSGKLSVDEIFYWDTAIAQPFEGEEIDMEEQITTEQAFANEPAPNVRAMPSCELETCSKAIRDFLRKVYPNDSGLWQLKTMHHDNGYIYAILRTATHDQCLIKRKLTVILDPKRLHVINYVDNDELRQMMVSHATKNTINFSKESAYDKLKGKIVLTPCYVYDVEQKAYVLCGQLDCDYGVNAQNGNLVNLDDL